MSKGTLILVVVLVIVGLVAGTLIITLTPARRLIIPETPKPSVEEIYGHVRPGIAPLDQVVAQGALNIDDAAKAQVMNAIREAMRLYSEDDNGRIALARVADEVRQTIRDARVANKWELVLSGTEIFSVFRRSEFFINFYTELAMKELARPQIELKGFMDDHEKNTTYIFLDIRVRGEDESVRMQVREGEEFLDPPHTVRLDRILGKNRGVRLEFLEIPGYTWDVMLSDKPVPTSIKPEREK
ncbi:MAG TPA: hypothetical protein PLO37_07260 [Candidatus Hydrogenedentes bacterium]|nr:hypothetical protein [Candidatus Hydrogenedentota bacterium]HPG66629.1 hypothetical protein [Candidatus Hydrogenedentota bacterium]